MPRVEVSISELTRSARLYRTDKQAANALGIGVSTYKRKCKEANIVTPNQQADERKKARNK